MTTTPVDMMSEAWIDKIEAETKPSEQTFNTSKNMTVKKTTSSIATRGLDSFLAFQSKEFISGYQNLVTIQPLNKSKTRGWFVRNSDLDTCGWSATENQFAKGSVLWNYKQTFGMAPNTSVEEGLNFTVQPQATVASEGEAATLWGGKSAEDESDAWTKTAGGSLPDLPGQYGPAPELGNEPF
jgi:hypothetical protein